MTLFLIGAALVYLERGSVRFEAVAGTTSIAALALILVGLLMKSGLFLSGLWLPVTHAEAPAEVSAVLSGVVVTAGIAPLLRFSCGVPALGPVVTGIALASALLGLVFALADADAKRLLAWSTLSQMGLVAPSPVAGGFYALSDGTAKAVLFLVARRFPSRALQGWRDRPLPAGVWWPLCIGSLSIVGLPPLAGFAAKAGLSEGLSLPMDVAVTLLSMGTVAAYARFWVAPVFRRPAAVVGLNPGEEPPEPAWSLGGGVDGIPAERLDRAAQGAGSVAPGLAASSTIRMAEGHVVEAGEGVQADAVDVAHRELPLRFAAGAAGHEGVGHQHGAVAGFAREGVVEQGHRLHLMLHGERHEPRDRRRLFLQQRDPVKAAAQMPVRGVQQTHRAKVGRGGRLWLPVCQPQRPHQRCERLEEPAFVQAALEHPVPVHPREDPRFHQKHAPALLGGIHQGFSPVRGSLSLQVLSSTRSPSTATWARARGSGAGPRTTAPSGSYWLPWQGQMNLFSPLFQGTTQPRCVQMALRPMAPSASTIR